MLRSQDSYCKNRPRLKVISVVILFPVCIFSFPPGTNFVTSLRERIIHIKFKRHPRSVSRNFWYIVLIFQFYNFCFEYSSKLKYSHFIYRTINTLSWIIVTNSLNTFDNFKLISKYNWYNCHKHKTMAFTNKILLAFEVCSLQYF